jgi:hypothetical protein
VNDHDRILGAGDGQEPAAGPAVPLSPPAAPAPPAMAASPAAPAPPVPPDPAAAAGEREVAAPGPQPELAQLADLVYERLAGRLRPEPAPPGDMPAVDEAVALRERAPELYDLWLRIAQDRAATGNYVQRAPYEVPERLAQSGRPRAVSSLVVVLAFCGYLAWLGGPGPYIAGLIAVLDLIVMLGLFFGLRPEHLPGTRRPGKKH